MRARTSQQWQRFLGNIVRKIISNGPVIHHTSLFNCKRNLFHLPNPVIYCSFPFFNWEHNFSKSTAKGLVASRGFSAKWDQGWTNQRKDTGTGLLLVYSDLSSGLLPTSPVCKRRDLAAVLSLLTFILANLATDLLFTWCFCIRVPVEASNWEQFAQVPEFRLRNLHLVLLTNVKIAPSDTWT